MQRYELFFIQPNIYTDFNTKDINLTSINENMEIEEEFTQILTNRQYYIIYYACVRAYIYNIKKSPNNAPNFRFKTLSLFGWISYRETT